MELLVILGIFGVWFALQLWVLPALGIPTCIGGSCTAPMPVEREAPPAATVPEKPLDGRRGD